MTHVHYKFSSKLSYNTVVFDDANITLGELKRLIMTREKLRASDCDLQITNAQTKEEYTDDDNQIPKGSSVIVRRVPSCAVKSNSSASKSERSEAYNSNYGSFKPVRSQPQITTKYITTMQNPMGGQKNSGVLPIFSKMANLASANVSEECKIKAIMNQSCYDSANYKRYGATLPANYICYRCGSTEHHIRNCPMSMDRNADPPLRIKKSSGIPRSFMVKVNDPSIKGALLTNTGHYAVPAIDAEAYAAEKKKISPQAQHTKDPPDNPIPDELICLICRDLLNDAVVIPCCGNSYCDDCVRSALLDSEDHVCPTCNRADVSPDTLTANKVLRQAVNSFKNEQGFTQSFKKLSSSCQSQECTPRPSPAPTPPLQCQAEKSQTADIPTNTTSDLTHSSLSNSLVVKVLDETPDHEADMKTSSSTATNTSVLVSDLETSDSQLHPIPLVTSITQRAMVENSSLVSVEQPGQAPYCDRSAQSAALSEGWTSLSTHLPTSSPTISLTQSPTATPSHIQTCLSVQQQSQSSYLSGFSNTTPPWTPGPSTQVAPISLFASSSKSSIPPLLPKELFLYQRKKERTPPRGSSYNSSSGFSSKSYKSKSSRSPSRSPSRSRSHSRSRPHSPYSSHRDLSNRSHSSRSYCYKRSHSPTPSASLRSRHQRRSKSPSDYRKSHHHSHRTTKRSNRSSSSSSSSRIRGESSHTSREAPDWSLDTYLRWKQEYKDWCEKYFNSYFSHFHQMPPPLQPHWPSHSHSYFTGHSPPSSDSRCSTSQSFSESSSTPLQFSSNSHSSTPDSDSRSTPTQSSSDSNSPSSDSCSGPSQQLSKDNQHRNMAGNQNKEKESEKEKSASTSSKNKHGKSKGDRKRKDQKLDKEKERKKCEDKEEKHHRVKASQKTENLGADKRRQSGHSKSLDSRSDKNRKEKNEDTLGNQVVSSITEPSGSDLFPKQFERKKQKKEVWKSQPITEEDVWEGGVTVKPQKKISINISLDLKMNEANAEQCDAIEKKYNNQTDNDVNKTENEVQEIIIPDEETRDEKNDSWETFAEDEAVGEDDLDLWQCALTTVDEEESVVKEEEIKSQEDEDIFKSQTNMAIDNNGRLERESYERDQNTEVKCLDMDRRVLETHSEHVQVTHSRWDKDAAEKQQQDKGPSNYREIKGRSKRRRSVEIENDKEIENINSSNRSTPPSSGQDITDSNFDFDRKGKKTIERESESREGGEGGHHRENIKYTTFYRKSPTGSSQAFTSVLEEEKSSIDKALDENRSKEISSRQIYMELDIQWSGKSDKFIPFSNYHHQNNHQDLTLSRYSNWTSLQSHSDSRDRGQLPSTSTQGSSQQYWTCTGQRPATPTAESSLGMALDMEKSKERLIKERVPERMQDRQNQGEVDSEKPGCSTNTSDNYDKNERRKDKKKQKSHKKEKRQGTPDEKKKSKKMKSKDARQED